MTSPTTLYPLPQSVRRRFNERELATLDMLEATLLDGGTHRRRTATEAELENRAARFCGEKQ